MSVSWYKLKKWYRMLTGQSIAHVHQGVGTCFSKTEVAGYYNDLTEKVTKDDPDILVPQYYVDTGEKILFSIGIFQYGLAAYDLFLQTGEEIYRKKVLACADWAIENQQQDGGFPTFTFENRENPYSSMAQGEGASLLLRAYQMTKTQSYYDGAGKAVSFLLQPLEEGGTAKYVDEDLYLYEFTDKPLVLNGWIFSFWGLWDYALMSGDAQVQRAMERTLQTMVKTIPDYDLGYWSRYDRTERIASPFYHGLHIALLRSMYALTGEETFRQYADLWEKYQKSPMKRARAFCVKAWQKIVER